MKTYRILYWKEGKHEWGPEVSEEYMQQWKRNRAKDPVESARHPDTFFVPKTEADEPQRCPSAPYERRWNQYEQDYIGRPKER